VKSHSRAGLSSGLAKPFVNVLQSFAYLDVLRAPILRNQFVLTFCNAYSFLPFQIVDPLLELVAFLAFMFILQWTTKESGCYKGQEGRLLGRNQSEE
jgi:hypothetical protein